MKTIKKYIRQLWIVYTREFSQVFHDAGLILFFTFLPLAYPVIYSLIYNPELVRNVKMVVVDHDRTPLSRKFVRNLDASQEIRIIGYAPDLNEARKAMNSHDCYGIMEIPQGFERNVGRQEEANAVMYCDMSLMLRYRGFLVAATNVSQELGAGITTQRVDEIAPLATTLAGGDMLPIENISLGNLESGFDSFIMPGVLVLILQQSIILACGMAGGAKRENRRRLGYNPDNLEPSVAMTMFGQMLCYITILLIPVVYMLHYVPMMFAFPMAGSVADVFMFALPLVISSIALGFIIQGIIRQREDIFVVWVVTSVVFLFLSGLTWPRYAMHGFWRFLSEIVPATWGVEGFIRINTNGGTLAQQHDAYIHLWILSAVYLVIAYAVQRWVVRPAALRESRKVIDG
ncbi:MAG: ABC transporter permease [Muribaculaceae bacterium]|nr:ABC transporter permease [Muribaculaceae bacterium]